MSTADAWWTGRPAIRVTRWIPEVPHPAQHAFLWLHQKEALYGGAAGGGKSDAMLMAALQYVDVPGYAALLLRRTYPELSQPGGLMSKAHEWLSATDARWNDTEKRWYFPSGATLTFGYLKTETDKYRYQGSEFQFIGFDELTQFRPEDYTYLFSRLRKASTGALNDVPLRMRTASNPGGTGHRWVKQRFLSEAGRAAGRIFVPAKLRDNPSVDKREYTASLEELDPQTRAQLLEGDWNARTPGNWVFDNRYIEAMVNLGMEYRELYNQHELVEPENGLAIAIDWGEITQAYGVWELEQGGVYTPPTEVVCMHLEPEMSTVEIIETMLDTGVDIGEARYDAAGVQSMRTFMRTVREDSEWNLSEMRSKKIPFNKFKYGTMGYMKFLARRTYEGKTVRIWAIDPANETLIDQLLQWERKTATTGEILEETTKENDHGPDANVAGIAPVAQRHRNARAVMNDRKKEAEWARAAA